MQSFLEKEFDRYQWNARVLPALVTLFPFGLAVLAWVDKPADVFKPLLVAVMGSGLLVTLANIARDMGNKAEDQLLKDWGSWPTTRLLRHSDSTLSVELKARYHAALVKLVPRVAAMPTPADEQADPKEADAIYESCVAYVRAITRDQHSFAILYAENIEYGYRRNMLGLRPLGIGSALIGACVCILKLVTDWSSGRELSAVALISGLLCLLQLGIWQFAISKSYVKVGADAYAERLLDAIDVLANSSPGAASKPKPPSQGDSVDNGS